MGKAKIRTRCLNIRFILDVLCFVFAVTASGLGCGALADGPDQGTSSPRAESGLFAMCFGAAVAFVIALITLIQSMMRGLAELDDGSTCKSNSKFKSSVPTVQWRPYLWICNHQQPAGFSGVTFPQPDANRHTSDCARGRANIHSGEGDVYFQQNFNQFAQTAPQQPVQQPSPFPVSAQPSMQLGPGALAPQPAPACQRQSCIEHLACPPHRQMQTGQPQTQPSMAPPRRALVAPVKADFGLPTGPSPPQAAVSHVEFTIISSEQQCFNGHRGHQATYIV